MAGRNTKVVLPNGETLNNIPDSASAQELKEVLVQSGHPELANAEYSDSTEGGVRTIQFTVRSGNKG